MAKRRRNKRWMAWLVILLILIIIGVICCLVQKNIFSDGKTQDGEEVDYSQIENNKITDEEKVEEKNEDSNNQAEKKIKQYEGDDPNTQEALSGSVTYAGILDQKLVIRVNIDQYLNEGTCELNLLNDGGAVYTTSANIISAASTATCEGFDVPISSVREGNYSIMIKLNSGGKTGIIKGEVNI